MECADSTSRRSAEVYTQAFNDQLKRKPFEQVSLLLCDFERCSDEQIKLLNNLLFSKRKECDSRAWADYIKYTCKSFPDRRLQLQRLVNKALELLDENVHKNDKNFLSIYLNSALLRKEAIDVARYIENSIYNRDIGVAFAELYIQWADVVMSATSSSTVAVEGNLTPLMILKMVSYKYESICALKVFVV